MYADECEVKDLHISLELLDEIVFKHTCHIWDAEVPQRQPVVNQGLPPSGGGGGPLGAGHPHGSRGAHHVPPPGQAVRLPLHQAPGGPPGGDDGGDGPGGGDGQDGESTPADEPPPGKRLGRPRSPHDDGDDFGDGLWGQSRKPVNISKWAKPLLKLDLPLACIFRRQARSNRCVRFGPRMWHLAAQYWQQIYGDSEARLTNGANAACRKDRPVRGNACMEGSVQSHLRVVLLRLYFVLSCLIVCQSG